MKIAVTVSLCTLLLCASRASAVDCRRATSPVEKQLCNDAGLIRLDERLNQLYSDLLPQLTTRAQAELRLQEKAWLAKRDQMCASGNSACLRSQYQDRIERLSALDAESRVAKEKLDSLAPPFGVVGTWKATAIHDPEPDKAASATDTHDSLARADLPDLGRLVSASPGRVCIEKGDCRFVAWKQTVLKDVPWAGAIERVLNLGPTSPTLVGDTGAEHVPGFLLLPQQGGAVWAVFSLRKTSIQDGNYAVEVWEPAAGQVGDLTQP